MTTNHANDPVRPDQIHRAQTADGKTVILWSSGAFTGAFGTAIPGIPIARPRKPEALSAALCVGRMIMGVVARYEKAELGALHARVRKMRPDTTADEIALACPPAREVARVDISETGSVAPPRLRRPDL